MQQKKFVHMSQLNIIHNIDTEIRNRFSCTMALSWNIKAIHVAILHGITQYKLVPNPELNTITYVSVLKHFGSAFFKSY